MKVKALGELFQFDFIEMTKLSVVDRQLVILRPYKDSNCQVNCSWNEKNCRHDLDVDVGRSTQLLNKDISEGQTDFYIPPHWPQTWTKG